MQNNVPPPEVEPSTFPQKTSSPNFLFGFVPLPVPAMLTMLVLVALFVPVTKIG